MNTLESCGLENPQNIIDTCAKFTIDDVETPFVLTEITTIDSQYAFSFWLKSETPGSIQACDSSFTSTTDWQKHSIVFTATDTGLAIHFLQSGVYYIYHPKLELGNKATDWSPAPEDCVKTITRYYQLTASEPPQKPTTNPPSEDWTIVEPTYAPDSTESLYYVDCIEYSGGFFEYSEVSKSSSWEAVKSVQTSLNTYIEATDEAISLRATKDEVKSAVDTVQTAVSELSLTADEIRASVVGTNGELDALSERVDLSISKDAVELMIQDERKIGATKVTTSTGYTFDNDGLTVGKSDSDTTTQITNNGMEVKEGSTVMLKANKDGVDAENLHATTFLIVGQNSRFEDYGSGRTACFWIGGS